MISPLSRLKNEDPVEESSINTGLQAGVNEKRAGDRCQARSRRPTLHILTRQSFKTEREQILQRPIVVDLHPASALRLRRGIQYRSDVTAAFNQKDLRVRLQLVTGVWKIRV
jgi:hypothetical protein